MACYGQPQWLWFRAPKIYLFVFNLWNVETVERTWLCLILEIHARFPKKMTDSSQLILSLILIKGMVRNSLQVWDTMSDMLSTSSDSPYRSLWRDKIYFNTLLNPTQTVLCNRHKASFLEYLFGGDLNHVFSMDMSRIFKNATTMKGAFTFADISLFPFKPKGFTLI